ncbi:glycosyltransferase family 4 protein [Micromonospora endophytica]|uniref:Glycosyltransferase family 1 protein n=1 Tax=Micromonospora endophytica TaxID=515350 RepID=A0A2W2CI30_9ACTN|nr:glycosyltransferase family 4 protein [Micromonospora endophytica]PZF98232.1 glycosyltransferase family 1 protein [Micromonospora endophytica]RIW41714.1 glycosyltransferase family 1 protein [Micromonospora endophytica]BCJ56620.1 glycogen synthase [Micromonospora endophytica]
MTTTRVGGRAATATDRLHRPTLTSRPQLPTQPGPASPPQTRRILMLSWEFPPVLVGGLGRHVHALSVALVAAGHEVTVVTRHAEGAPLEEYVDGVRVVRAAEDPVTFPLATESLLAWTMAFNHTLTRAALRAAATGGYDVIHAHDWLVAHTAMTLRDHLDLPLVSTIHATEAGRHQGWLPEEMNRTIHGVEHWLSTESTRVVVCSGYMRDEVTGLFGVPTGRVDVVPNGVESGRWRAPASAVAQARARFAADGPLVTFAGRLVYEKGVQHLLAGLPRLRERHPGLRAVIVGDGPYRAELEADVHRLGLADTVSLPGFLGGTDLPAVMAASDCFAVPSIYEPFGMVALEGAAAGAPLAVAETGGLAEIVEPGVTGMTFRPHDPEALTDAVHALLSDTERARALARRARVMVDERYGWAAIASRTASTYAAAIAQAPGFVADRATHQMAYGRSRPMVPEGNLLAAAGLR